MTCPNMSKREVMSKIEIVEKTDPELVRFLDERIAEYNWQHWEVSQRLPLAAQLKNALLSSSPMVRVTTIIT